MKKCLILFLFLLIFLVPKPTFAADKNIDCDASSCSPTTLPSFLPSILWYPGMIESRTVNISNSSNSFRAISIRPSNTTSTKNLANSIKITIKNNNQQIWYGRLDNFYDLSDLTLPTIPPQSSNLYTFSFLMAEDSGNEYQEGTTTFNLIFNVSDSTVEDTSQNSSSQDLTPTPTLINNGGSNNSGDNNSSNNNSNSTNTAAPQQSILTGLSTVNGQSRQTLGSSSDNDTTADTKDVLGTSNNFSTQKDTKGVQAVNHAAVCSNNYTWIIIIIIETAILIIGKFYLRRNMFTKVSPIMIVIAVIIIYALTCIKGYALLGLIPSLLILKNKK